MAAGCRGGSQTRPPLPIEGNHRDAVARIIFACDRWSRDPSVYPVVRFRAGLKPAPTNMGAGVPRRIVITAEAGIHLSLARTRTAIWIPACAGMTGRRASDGLEVTKNGAAGAGSNRSNKNAGGQNKRRCQVPGRGVPARIPKNTPDISGPFFPRASRSTWLRTRKPVSTQDQYCLWSTSLQQ